ncbi:hypothetical protein JNB63_01985 [Microbacterium trichothecenolyticum]|uniref:hypothetical protein n=1 Tax=Microbacterium trichothecenolyticum TaxID=69370 RepID=UPI001C6F22EB|nr:hypothetical protein [Microbacterium trichothecenolyticum]MBW9118855.1 hypothetical protein [Microbacterium trichothecenolyticum]
MEVTDDEWESAAVAQLAADVRDYPGGGRGFVQDHGERLAMSYDSFNKNLNGSSKITYRTFTRAVHILGYTPEEYDSRIMTRIEAQRRRAAD